jgi:proteasome accessory factor A
MTRVFGIETEYGITISGAESVDVVAESIELVRSCSRPGVLMNWNYALEDPHRDARGFRATQLLQDTDESAYFEIDRKRPLSFEEIKSDLALTNGARFYNDHAHPEYSTPECTTLRQLVAHDKAGERILLECARRRSEQLPSDQRVQLYKNNTDFCGHSYGCHENYLMRRDVPWERIVRGVIPFFVTRQIFAGAGKLGLEAESAAGEPGVYQISQRADFFRVIQSVDTMNKRPLVNTRDEPHADPAKYRRLHVIIGDSNRSEWATAMKVGTTGIVLELIERGLEPDLELARPIDALKAISRDPDYRWVIELHDGRKISAIDVQRLYLQAAQRADLPKNAETSWLLEEWETALNDLEHDTTVTRDRVDWVAKKHLLSALREEERLDWSDPWLQAVDLEYHNLDPDEGLFQELVRQGAMRRFVTDNEVQHAMEFAPETTRANFRGGAVARFGSAVTSVQWDEIVFREGKRQQRVALPEPSADRRLEQLAARLRDEKNFAAFFERLS